MNTRKKFSLLTLVTLIALSMLSLFASTATAALNFTTSITATNPTVGDSATYTFTITNTGTSNLAAINVTVPLAYYNITNAALTQQPPSQTWNLTYSPLITDSQGLTISDGTVILVNQTGQGLTNGQSITFTFNALNAQVAGSYTWNTLAVASDGSTSTITTGYTLKITSILPALAILSIAAAIAFINTGVNRVLINYFIGWDQYRVMQKEMAEFRRESMAAAKANDKKQMEKLKKKQSQINNMNAKMMKPQMLQIGISFIYLIVWFLVLIPTFGNISMAYLPGVGPISVAWLYPICSMFLGLVASRTVGVMPIENQ
jgi:uncharacterized membrane protein (DUF106 family)